MSVRPGMPSTVPEAEYCQIQYRRQPPGSIGSDTP